MSPSVNNSQQNPPRTQSAAVLDAKQARITQLISAATVLTVLGLCIAKLVAYLFSGSATVLSSFLDSLTDIGLSIMTFMSLRFAQKPPDDEHRDGHGKIEGVAALLQAAFIAGAGALLVLEGVNRLFEPVALENQSLAFWVLAGSTVVSLFLNLGQRWAMRFHNSLALEADNAHYANDVYLNLAATIVLLLYGQAWAPLWLDPVCALFIAGLMARTALQITHSALDMLLDREVPPETRLDIQGIITTQPDVSGYHDLRTRMIGQRMAISFDLAVDADLSLRAAHEIARKVELALLDKYPLASILIHVDPDDDTHDTRHAGFIG